MKKLTISFLSIITILTISCKKNLSNNELEPLTFQDVAKSLDFTLNPKSIPQLLNRYGTPEDWQAKIVNFRKSKPKKLNQSIGMQDATQSSGTLTIQAYKHVSGFNIYEGVIHTDDDVFIYDAADVAGFRFRQCDRAGCGSACAALLKSGFVDDANQSFLTDEQIERGFILPCVTYALSNCEIVFNCEELLDNPSICDLDFNQSTNYLDAAIDMGEELDITGSNGANGPIATYADGSDDWNTSPNWKFFRQRYPGSVIAPFGTTTPYGEEYTAFWKAVVTRNPTAPYNGYTFKTIEYKGFHETGGHVEPCRETTVVVTAENTNIYPDGLSAKVKLFWTSKIRITCNAGMRFNTKYYEKEKTFLPTDGW